MNKHHTLIASLCRHLAPVQKAPDIDRLAMLWFVLGAMLVVTLIHLTGPIRPGAFSQLLISPRFLLESLLGLTAIVWVCVSAFRAAIPGGLSCRFYAFGIILIIFWLAHYLFGLLSPALEPSTAGKRSHCFSETLLYSLPLILSGQVLVRRLYPLRPIHTSMMLSLAAGMLPALYMQLACMYQPTHILTYHILPGLLMVPTGAVIAMLWRPRHSTPIDKQPPKQ